jgi:hypothetical protein
VWTHLPEPDDLQNEGLWCPATLRTATGCEVLRASKPQSIDGLGPRIRYSRKSGKAPYKSGANRTEPVKPSGQPSGDSGHRLAQFYWPSGRRLPSGLYWRICNQHTGVKNPEPGLCGTIACLLGSRYDSLGYSSGIPALRRPVKRVASYRVRIVGML